MRDVIGLRPLFGRFALTSALLAAASALSACRPAVTPGKAPELEVRGSDFDRDPETVATRGALEDLDRVLYVFSEAYAGVDGRPRTPAPDAVAEARQQIGARTAIPPRAFAGLLRQLFRQPDGHLAFGYGGSAPIHLPAKPYESAFVSGAVIDRVDSSGRAWLSERRLLGCTPRDGRRGEAQPAVLPTPSGRFVLGVFGDASDSELACKIDSAPGASPLFVAMRATTSAPAQALGAPVTFDDGRIPVLGIRTFDNAAVDSLRGLPALARRLRASPGFVVDLRGNGGGNFGFAEDFLLELTNAELLRIEEREVVSVAAAVGRANTVRRSLAAGAVPHAAVPHFEAELAALEAQAGELRAAHAPRTEIVVAGETMRGRARGPLRSRAVFLVDGGCASACEMLIALARQIPGAIVVGQNTHGGMAVGELALFRLEHSGITVTLGTRAFRDPLGDFDEARGFLPDLWAEGHEALDAAIHLASGSLEIPLVHPRGRRRPSPPTNTIASAPPR